MSGDADALLAQLDPVVQEFRNDAFCLGEDLKRLNRVRAVKAPEAVVLYCGRALEVLSGSALLDIKLKPATQPFSNLLDLERFNLISPVTLFLAHGLRRVANNARHVTRQLESAEAEAALIYLERWLHWYFCTYRFGPKRPALAGEAEPFALSQDAPLREFVAQLEAEDLPNAELQSLTRNCGAIWQHSASVAAILAEMLIERREFKLATQVLDSAQETFRNDLRLTQLRALWFSRNGRPDEAVRLLQEASEDDETLGIRGGALKRLWEKDCKRARLEECYSAYCNGWDKSKGANVYLGINAATTALWLERKQKAQEIAAKVRELLEKRQAAIAQLHGALSLGFWDQVTLAEARLLLGDFDAARTAYNAAFGRGGEKISNMDVAKEQARKILLAQGKTAEEAAKFFDEAPESAPPM